MKKLLKLLYFAQQARALSRRHGYGHAYGRDHHRGYGYGRSRDYHPFYRSHRRSIVERVLGRLLRGGR